MVNIASFIHNVFVVSILDPFTSLAESGILGPVVV